MPLPMRRKHFSNDLVTIKVGTGQDSEWFQVHRNVICHSSKFFKVAFTSRFKEAAKQHWDLPEEKVDAFSFFCDRLYSGQVRPAKEYTFGDYPDDLFWYRVWVMADRLNATYIQNVIPLLPSAKEPAEPDYVPSLEFIAELFHNSIPNTFIERMFIRYSARKLRNEHADWKNYGAISHGKPEICCSCLATYPLNRQKANQANSCDLIG
jgi:hypothetical protein